MTDDKATPADVADVDAIGMRHLAWYNDAPGMASWPGKLTQDDATTYMVRKDIPVLLAALAAERDRVDRAEARLAEARKRLADFEATA